MNIGSRLKQILEERNINVSRFAREAEVPAQTLYAMIKRDSNKADMDIMARILEALDMDLLEFLEMEPRKRATKKTAPEKTEVIAEEILQEEAEDIKAQEPESEEVPAKEPEPVRSYRRELEDYLL